MAASTAMPSVQRCRSGPPPSPPNPRLLVVRSDRAPASGVAITDEMAPTPAETTASATYLWCGVMS